MNPSPPRSGHNEPAAGPRAFTLLELLVVISIIAILMVVLLPAMNEMLDAAAKTTARQAVGSIVNAIASFETDYARFPTNAGTVSGGLLDSLTGLNTNDNPRKVVFLNAPPARRGRSGTNEAGFVDPWSMATPYLVVMDTNYSGTVNVSTNGQASGSVAIPSQVAVWNLSPTNKKHQVRSWD